MKLPEDQKERTQILVLIMIGVLAVIYALYQLQINVISKPRKAAEKEISKLEGELQTANSYIGALENDLRDNEKVMSEIKEVNAKYILHPRLGDNYLLSAEEILEKIAKEHEVEIEVNEIGMTEIAQKTTTPKDFAFKTYTVRVEFYAGLHKTIDFLKAVEKSNPYFCVCNLSILAQKDDFEEHEMSFDVQWPIWIMNDLTSQTLQAIHNESDRKMESADPVGPLPPTKGEAGKKIDPSKLINPGGGA